MGSQPGGGTATPPGDWVATAFIVIGSCVAAAGLILGWLWLGLLGGVLAAGGVVGALANGMMSHVEEYEERRQDT